MTHRSNDYIAFLAITLVISAAPALAVAASTAIGGTTNSDQESVSSTLAGNTDTTTKPTIAGSATGNTTVTTPVGRSHRKGTHISPVLPTDGSQPAINSNGTISTTPNGTDTQINSNGTIGNSNAGAGVGGTISTGGKK